MQLFVLHGPSEVALNNKLLNIKNQFEGAEISQLNGKEINFGQLLTELGSMGLFAPARLVIINNPEDLEIEKLTDLENVALVLVYSKTLASNSKVLKAAIFKKAQVMNFPESAEVSVFPFLDALAEKRPQAFEQLQILLKQYGGQYILTMIFYLLRRFVMSPKSLPPFILKKHNLQKKNFPEERIKELYRLVLETDFKIKSGLIDEGMGLLMLTKKFLK